MPRVSNQGGEKEMASRGSSRGEIWHVHTSPIRNEPPDPEDKESEEDYVEVHIPGVVNNYVSPGSKDVYGALYDDDIVYPAWRYPRCTNCCAMKITEAVPGFVKQAEYLSSIPRYLLAGPWSYSAFAFFLCLLLAVIVVCAVVPLAQLLHYPHEAEQALTEAKAWLIIYRWVFAVVCGSLMVWSLYVGKKLWAFITFTIQSFTFLVLHLLFAALGSLSSSPALRWARVLAVLLRAPALLQASIVVSVWWLILTPIIFFNLPSPGHRRVFFSWVCSPFLLLIHGANLPILGVEFLGTGVPLTNFDLVLGLAFAMIYLVFYLLVLDANSIHLYVILSPRTAACVLVYAGILGIYIGLYTFWNRCLEWIY